MSDMANDQPIERVSVSLAQLRAELTGLELRLVDRLNGALESKVDVHLFEQALTRVGENSLRINTIEKEMVSLHEIAKYKKWLWAQTLALVAIAIPILVAVITHFQA